MADDADFETLISSHRQELMNASASHADLDLAFRLQMEEAMAASAALHPSTSSSSPPLPPPSSSSDDDDIQDLISLQTLELDRFRQESQDNHLSQSEMLRISADLHRKIHDESFAREIDSMPEEEWEEYGDNYEKPMEEEERPFRVYFKGISSEEVVGGELVWLAAVGAAVCDPDDRLILKVQKPLLGAGQCPRGVVEGKALIEALAAAETIGAKNVDIFFDYRAFYNHVGDLSISFLAQFYF